jgi:predicted nucleic acid-binding protein
VGTVLDSSVIIVAERRGDTVREILEQVKAVQGEIEIGVSVVTIAELVHGAIAPKPNCRTHRRPTGSDGYPVCVREFADRRDSVASLERRRVPEFQKFQRHACWTEERANKKVRVPERCDE